MWAHHWVCLKIGEPALDDFEETNHLEGRSVEKRHDGISFAGRLDPNRLELPLLPPVQHLRLLLLHEGCIVALLPENGARNRLQIPSSTHGLGTH